MRITIAIIKTYFSTSSVERTLISLLFAGYPVSKEKHRFDVDNSSLSPLKYQIQELQSECSIYLHMSHFRHSFAVEADNTDLKLGLGC